MKIKIAYSWNIICLFSTGHFQNPPNQIREPLTDGGLGVTVIVKNK